MVDITYVVTFSCFTGSYGSTKRYKSIQRVQRVNDTTIIGASGELSDFQYILDQLSDVVTDDFCMDDGISRGPKEIYSWLSRVLYGRRNKYGSLCSSRTI
jgi:20S proteasome subunit beta 7